jgi:hypothetical protein
MFGFVARMFGIESDSQVESVIKDCYGNYFVMREGRDSAIGVSAEDARNQVRKLGGDPKMVDELEKLP